MKTSHVSLLIPLDMEFPVNCSTRAVIYPPGPTCLCLRDFLFPPGAPRSLNSPSHCQEREMVMKF